MQYITDTHKNITHVLVPIEEWNILQAKTGDHKSLNPYQPIIDYMEAKVGETKEEYRNIFPPEPESPHTMRTRTGERDHLNMPIYRLLINLLKGDKYIREIAEDIKNPNISTIGLDITSTSFVIPRDKVDVKSAAISYILRNEEFYRALCNSENTVSPSEYDIFDRYGFNIEKFKSEIDQNVLTVLYKKHKSEFIREAWRILGEYFSLVPIKDRIRREPEVIRLFFFDVFEAVDELSSKEPSFDEIFRKNPLVDKLAKEFYPSNTLSGSTSRVYKATKEARTIVAGDWKKYVLVD